MGVEHGANDGKSHAGDAAVAPGGKKAVEYLGPVVGRDAFAVVDDHHLQRISLPRRGDIERRAAMAHGVVGEIGKNDAGVLLRYPIGVSRSPPVRMSSDAKAERKPAIRPDSFVAPTATGFSARAKSRRRPEIFASRSASAMMLSRNFRLSLSAIMGVVAASISSRKSSAAP